MYFLLQTDPIMEITNQNIGLHIFLVFSFFKFYLKVLYQFLMKTIFMINRTEFSCKVTDILTFDFVLHEKKTTVAKGKEKQQTGN